VGDDIYNRTRDVFREQLGYKSKNKATTEYEDTEDDVAQK
jgi:hypothetical protein